jgi:hypothetical protein
MGCARRKPWGAAMKHSELQALGQIGNLIRIFTLLEKLESKHDGLGRDALEWAYGTVRDEGPDADWRAASNVGNIGRFVHDVTQLTQCEPALVAAIGGAVMLPSRPALLLDELRRFEVMYPNGYREPRPEQSRG